MSPRLRLRTATATLVVAALALLPGAAPAAAAGVGGSDVRLVPAGDGRPTTGAEPTMPGALSTPAQRRSEDVRTKRVLLEWSGSRGKREKTVVVPEIGQLRLVCRPNNTMVKIVPFDRDAETQMWLAKHEVKGGDWAVAVKNVRVYRYATAADDGTGGTGRAAHEGLNQDTPVEDFSKGYMNGVISQRPGRHAPAAGVPTPPSTALTLNWWWERFRTAPRDGYCKVDVTLRTQLSQSIGVSWHGDADGARQATATTPFPGLGDLEITCTPDPDGRGGTQWLVLRTDDPDAYVELHRIEAEGREQDHVREEEDGYAATLGTTFPTLLPENGMLRLWLHAHGQVRALTLSSYHVTNDPDPRLNLCEVAAALAP